MSYSLGEAHLSGGVRACGKVVLKGKQVFKGLTACAADPEIFNEHCRKMNSCSPAGTQVMEMLPGHSAARAQLGFSDRAAPCPGHRAESTHCRRHFPSCASFFVFGPRRATARTRRRAGYWCFCAAPWPGHSAAGEDRNQKHRAAPNTRIMTYVRL